MLETWSLLGRLGSPENPAASGFNWNRSCPGRNRSEFISLVELLGELEASRSSLGRGLGASLLSPVKSKHLVEPSPSPRPSPRPSPPPSPTSGERSCWGELELDIRGDPTVRFSLEVVEEDTLLSDRNRLELLGTKILKGKVGSS